MITYVCVISFMSQKTSGIFSVLSHPFIYSLFQWLIGVDSFYKNFARNYIRPQTGDRILDIGCGPADIVAYLPDVDYVGFDASPDYIKAAQKRFGHYATFKCELVSTRSLEQNSSFDLVLANGVLHHLDDAEALQLFKLAKSALKSGGRLVTFDGVFINNQSPVAKWIISKDRGQNVRTQKEYIQLASQVFSAINVNIRHDLLRIPYTHIILECTHE